MTFHRRDEHMMTSSIHEQAPAPRPPRQKGVLRRFTRNANGSIAIEFAMLALPFSLLVFAILESCISFAAQQVLANATDDVARQFRTGQIRAEEVKNNPDIVRDKICARLEVVVSNGCPGLLVDLRPYDTFVQAAAQRTKFKPDGDIEAKDFKILLGKAGDKNQLRVFYRWPVITDFMRKAMSNLPDGKTLHFASVTWQNEPFDD